MDVFGIFTGKLHYFVQNFKKDNHVIAQIFHFYRIDSAAAENNSQIRLIEKSRNSFGKPFFTHPSHLKQRKEKSYQYRDSKLHCFFPRKTRVGMKICTAKERWRRGKKKRRKPSNSIMAPWNEFLSSHSSCPFVNHSFIQISPFLPKKEKQSSINLTVCNRGRLRKTTALNNRKPTTTTKKNGTVNAYEQAKEKKKNSLFLFSVFIF